ncbi:MAG: NADP-specific glutamate dehydrogenase [Deltaproteobacteria bacterium]|nr:MAG: NADP-specific glutamate dehydrogenase [Deltaproteobacteria bacterium]
MHPYAARVFREVSERVPWEVEFLQAVQEVFETITPVLEQTTLYEEESVLERLVEPQRVHAFRVVWHDDAGRVRVNRGWRVQFNNAIGPFKGGLRFHSSVTLSGLKFLGFEQTFKNALTGLPMGGGKGGSDFSPRGASDREIERFCHSFMTSLYRYIGAEVDVPAGDIGVGAREIGYLFGQYKRLTETFSGVLTGKGLNWGGSKLRPEATGFGLVYFAQKMLERRGEELAGKRVSVSGFGNVAWGAVKKATELGAKVVTLSGPDGYIYDPEGVSGEKIDYMLELRSSGMDVVQPYAERYGVEFHAGRRPWEVPVDVALPCAIQNELESADAERLVANGCKYVAEGANMPTTPDAVRILRQGGIVYAPGKASNAGGVGTSGLEMAQNRTNQTWTAERVDTELRRIMTDIHDMAWDAAATCGNPGDYLQGANVAGFLKVADSMVDQGSV